MLKLPTEENSPSGGIIPYSSPTAHPQAVWQPGRENAREHLPRGLTQHQIQHGDLLGCCREGGE